MSRLGGRWKQWAATFRDTPLHPQWLYREPRRWLPELRALSGGGMLLDIGAGEGWVKERLPAGWRYIGFDHPAVGIGWYGAKPDVSGDASALPFAASAFDAITMLEVVEHLERPEMALSEVDRVLRPGGVLICSVPFLYPVHDAPRDFQRITIHGFHEVAKRFGWSVESERRLAPGFQAIAVQFGVGVSSLVVARGGGKISQRFLAFALLPFVALANVFAVLLSQLLPDVAGLAGGHIVVFRKPHASRVE